MVCEWELEKVKDWTTGTIKNHIWRAVEVRNRLVITIHKIG
jgi:hypothetical protein